MGETIELLYRLQVHDKHGKLVADSGEKPSRSFVIAFMKHIECAILDANVTVIDTGNVSRTVPSPSTGNYFLRAVSAGASSLYSIQVGTGTTAESNTDYALATLITSGSGSGQLVYGTPTFTATAVVGSNVDFIMTRTFSNSSGASITVNEIGLTVYTDDSLGPTRYFLILRDLETQAVGNGQVLTINYTLRTTV